MIPCPDREHCPALGQAISLKHENPDVIEELVDMGRQRPPAGDRPAEATSDHSSQFFEHELIQQEIREDAEHPGRRMTHRQ